MHRSGLRLAQSEGAQMSMWASIALMLAPHVFLWWHPKCGDQGQGTLKMGKLSQVSTWRGRAVRGMLSPVKINPFVHSRIILCPKILSGMACTQVSRRARKVMVARGQIVIAEGVHPQLMRGQIAQRAACRRRCPTNWPHAQNLVVVLGPIAIAGHVQWASRMILATGLPRGPRGVVAVQGVSPRPSSAHCRLQCGENFCRIFAQLKQCLGPEGRAPRRGQRHAPLVLLLPRMHQTACLASTTVSPCT